MRQWQIITTLILFWFFSACVVQKKIVQMPIEPKKPPVKLKVVAGVNRAKAQQFRKEGNLHYAAIQWRIVESIEGASDEITRIQTEIMNETVDQVSKYYAAAISALAKNNNDKARLALLKVLAADPSQEAAVLQLRMIEKNLLRKIRSKNTKNFMRKNSLRGEKMKN